MRATTTIGILAVQGGFAAHARSVRALGYDVRLIRRAADARGLDGLILPGGESSTQLRHLETNPDLRRALDACVERGLPVLATCAGAILAASEVEPPQTCLGWFDIAAERNAYGPQIASAQRRDDDDRYDLVLIRAPRLRALSPRVQILARLEGEPVLMRQGRRVAASFHPELSDDLSLHAQVFIRSGSR